MIHTRRYAKHLGILLLLAVAGCAGQEPAQRTLSGTFSVAYDNVGGVVGFHDGHGTLVLNDGTKYAFTADGYSLASLGYSVATASGNVYNLTKPSDFSGEYGASGATAVIGVGTSNVLLKNRRNNTLIDYNSKEEGLRFGLGGGFVTFTLGKMLNGPVAMKAEPKKPEPMPAKPMAMPAKKTHYEIEFGFNKSRVTLATGKLLDSIASDWRDSKATFVITGHTDTVGSEKYNDRLSTARADNIKKALVERGIAASRVDARGVGEEGLAVKTPNDSRLRANRRVVIDIRNLK